MSSLASLAPAPAAALRARAPSSTRRATRGGVVSGSSSADAGAAVQSATDGKHAAAALAAIDNCVTSSNLRVGTKYEGKVRAANYGRRGGARAALPR